MPLPSLDPLRLSGRSPRTTLATLAVVVAALAGCSSGPAKSSDDNLSALSVSVGTLTPPFSANTSSYGVTVPGTTTSVTVTATTSSDKATLQVSGVDATSGTPSQPQPLTAGPNLIDVAVYAEDGSVRVYDITVTR